MDPDLALVLAVHVFLLFCVCVTARLSIFDVMDDNFRFLLWLQVSDLHMLNLTNTLW